MAKTNRCCFTGHRPEKLHMTEEEVKDLLRIEIKNALLSGLYVFITGMARGIDMWAAEIVLEEREKNPQIKLVCASPYMGFETRWRESEQRRYNSILSEADLVEYICDHYDIGAFQLRNKWMVDRSVRVIAAYNGAPGGTKNTINYAKKQGVEIINILEKNI